MIKKIIHLADVHFFASTKYRQKYADILTSVIESIKEETKDYAFDEKRIVIVGDLTNDKSHTSNPLMQDTFEFLNKLGEIAPVKIIGGNHDFNVTNTTDIDTVTLITQYMKPMNCVFLDSITEHKSACVIDDNVVWCLYSTYDNYLRPDIELTKVDNPDKTFIGLFHESVTGGSNDTGTVLSGFDLSIFKNLDFACLGHIHKRQSFDYKGIKIAYSGSTIQKDFGESVGEHGYLIWDLETKDFIPVDIPNEYGYYKYEINSLDDIQNDKEILLNE